MSFVECKFEEARRSFEIRPIVGWRGEKWLLSFNPIVEANLAGPQKGVLVLPPAFKEVRDVGGGSALGVEYYADLGRLSNFAPRAEQAHTLYLVIDTKTVNFGIGKGIRGGADPWTLKAIFSF